VPHSPSRDADASMAPSEREAEHRVTLIVIIVLTVVCTGLAYAAGLIT